MQLLETMRWRQNKGIWLHKQHLQRLQKSAQHFNFRYDQKAITIALQNIQCTGDLRVRLTLASGGEISISTTPIPQLITSNNAKRLPKSGVVEAAVLGLDTQPTQSDNLFLRHKTTSRKIYEDAQQRAGQGGPPHDVILWNERGEVTETAIGSIVIRMGKSYITPPLASGLLPGTFRAQLLANGLIREEVISIASLENAEQIFRVNSVRGWAVVRLANDS